MPERGHIKDIQIINTSPNDHKTRHIYIVLVHLLLFTLAVSVLALASSAEGEEIELNVTNPEEGMLINNTTVHVTGTVVNARYLGVLVESSSGEHNFTFALPPGKWFNVTMVLWEGINLVTVYASMDPITDLLTGNITNGTNVTRMVTVDTTPPLLVISSPSQWPTYTKSHVIPITGQVDMDPNGLDEPHSGVFTMVVPLLVGENMIPIRFVDEAGNEALEWVYVIADWTVPTVLIEKPWPDPYITNNPTVLFQGKAGMGVDVLRLIHNDVEYDITSTWQYDLELGPADLESVVTVRAMDHAGNMVEDNVTVILDIVPPSLSIDGHSSTLFEEIYWINGSVDEDGIEVVQINDMLYPIVDRRFSVLLRTSDLAYPIEISVLDRAGNQASILISGGSPPPPPIQEIEEARRISTNTYIIRGTTARYVQEVTIHGKEYPVVDGEFSAEIKVDWNTDRVLVEAMDPLNVTWTESVDLGRTTEPWISSLVIIIISCVVVIGFVIVRRQVLAKGRQP
jgi:hypothetical protein